MAGSWMLRIDEVVSVSGAGDVDVEAARWGEQAGIDEAALWTLNDDNEIYMTLSREQ